MRKLLKFTRNVWIKKCISGSTDVTVRTFDGASCKTFEIYLLSKLRETVDKRVVGLYLDNGQMLRVAIVLIDIRNESIKTLNNRVLTLNIWNEEISLLILFTCGVLLLLSPAFIR